jgi:SNF2 family DNA or RNA helicase
LPAFAFGDLAALCEATGAELPQGYAELEALARDFAGIPDAELPADLTAELRHYQRDGVSWLGFLRDAKLGALLADDMGLGKTLQALCAIRGRTLVVAPRSVLHNWESEAARFRAGLTVHTYHGPDRTLDDDADLTLTTYAVLRLDGELLTGRAWDTVVLDESQAIKNPDSQVSRIAHRLQAGFRIALTGTPVENRLDDLWSQFQFLNAGLLGGRQSFTERYVKPIANGDAEAAARLRLRLRPFVLRRHKRDVAPELPPRTELVLSCELDETERSVYDAVRAATRDEVVGKLDEGASTFAILEALLRLRQAACHPALVPGQADLAGSASSKVQLLVDTLDEAVAEGHKALVFSQWTSLLDEVEPHLRNAALGFVRLDGSTRDRKGVVDSFQQEDGPPVMLLSLKAGGTGLNLTAADHVFLLDPWWNPAVEDQAADRAHRIGQEKPVFVHRLIAEDTVEERILALQARKRELAETAVGDRSTATSITREDLLALVE